MIIVLFFVSVLLSYLPFLHSTSDYNTSRRTCPKSFSCPDFRTFEYPFYNGTNTRCGLIKVNCTKNGGEIQFGGQSYEIRKNVGYGSLFFVHNRTFEKLVNNESCEALLNNFTSPSPLLYSISIQPFTTLFKCTKNPNYTTQTDAYFDDYYSYNRCKDHNFYYKNLNSNTAVPSDLPQRCEVILLPVQSPDDGNRPDHKNIFSILSSQFYIFFHISHSCEKCHNKEGWCKTHNGKFRCLDAKKDKWDKKLILIAVGSAIILMLSFVVLIIWRCYKRNRFAYFSSKDKSQDLEDESICFGVPVFSYTELEHATRNFDPSQELGDGGFGAVYYGKLKDGREVAVKRLYENNYKRVQQFMNEVEILTRLRHKNLVLLYGCTSSRSRELLLVYEYIPNGTVADHLHGEQANPSLLTWPVRMKIAIETARALVYLHASEIIHRDVKTSNLLLDHNFCVKVADFGLSRLLPNDVTHVSTAPQGTPGYVDPQYHQCFQLTDKSDVYSFGVVLIELISSMEAVDVNRSRDEIGLANLAISKIHRDEVDELIDPLLGSDSDAEIKRMITSVAELAFLCLQFDSDLRPAMTEVLEILEDIQGEGRTEAQDSIGELKNLKPSPSPETEDALVLLKNLQPSPVSVTGKWYSDSSRSTTLSISGDRLPMKNRTSS